MQTDEKGINFLEGIFSQDAHLPVENLNIGTPKIITVSVLEIDNC